MPRFLLIYLVLPRLFCLSEKELLSKSLFIILHKCESKKLDDSFTNFGGVASGPIAFLIFMWLRGVAVITTAQLHSTKPELRFCAGSNPIRGVSEIRDGEDL